MGDADVPPYSPRRGGYFDSLTAAQNAAFKELLRQLPSALKDLPAEQLTLWGVPLADLAAAEQPKLLDDATKDLGASRVQGVVLLKFLRARQFNAPAALTMLVNCLKWRRDFDVPGLSLETFPRQLAAAGQLSGRDRAGNPVTYNYYGTDVDLESVFGSPGGVASFVRWRVKLMEQAVGLLDFDGGVEHVTQVHDYSGASLFRMDSHVKAASREIIRLFQDNYPEMLSAKLFVNVPRVMEFVFGLFSAFTDVVTRAKFVMASPARARSVLLQYIDPLQLPARFGGALETCSVPPNRGRAASLALGSKNVCLKPGDSHVTSKLVGTDSEVVWCFCTTGPELSVSIGFRPRDNGEAAAAAARLPDHISGVVHPHSRHGDAQHINESHYMTIAKDAANGRLVLGCPGEVVMTLANTRSAGRFSSGQGVTVHYALIANDASNGHAANGSLSSVSVGNNSADNNAGGRVWDAGPPHALDWRNRVLSYKSFGCSSLTSNDVADMNQAEGSQPDSPRGQQAYASGVVVAATAVASGRIETVPEVDESGTVSPARTTVHDGIFT